MKKYSSRSVPRDDKHKGTGSNRRKKGGGNAQVNRTGFHNNSHGGKGNYRGGRSNNRGRQERNQNNKGYNNKKGVVIPPLIARSPLMWMSMEMKSMTQTQNRWT